MPRRIEELFQSKYSCLGRCNDGASKLFVEDRGDLKQHFLRLSVLGLRHRRIRVHDQGTLAVAIFNAAIQTFDRLLQLFGILDLQRLPVGLARWWHTVVGDHVAVLVETGPRVDS